MTRKTIKEPIKLKGIGLHTGSEINLEILPDDSGKGIKVFRKDVPESVAIPADISAVADTQRSTTIAKGNSSVSTVEHLLSALAALGISDVLIHVDGPEIPILDGSALPFAEAIERAGTQELEKQMESFVINEALNYFDEETGAEYQIWPSDEFQATVLVDFEDTPIQAQYAELKSLNDFKKEIAPARTFVLAKDLLQLAKQNLIKGGDATNAVVLADRAYAQKEIDDIAHALGKESLTLGDNGIFNPEGLRFGNEPSRHKIVDLIGDLSLLGVPIQAKIIAKKPGHTSNVRFVSFLKKKYLDWKKIKGKPHYDPNEEPVVDLEGIKALLPHRYPFLLVDKIIEISANRVVGIKSVTFNEQFFQGHFPGNPVFPGVLQMEALAQTGGILALSSVDDPELWDTYFLKMDNVKFKNKVVPGDTLILKMELLSPIRRGIVHMQGTTYVGNKIVSEGELIAQIIKRK